MRAQGYRRINAPAALYSTASKAELFLPPLLSFRAVRPVMPLTALLPVFFGDSPFLYCTTLWGWWQDF